MACLELVSGYMKSAACTAIVAKTGVPFILVIESDTFTCNKIRINL